MESQLNQNQQNQNQNNKIISDAFDIFVGANIAKINAIIDEELLEKSLQDVSRSAGLGVESFLKGRCGGIRFLVWEKKLNTLKERFNA
jgi:hypothetical protein